MLFPPAHSGRLVSLASPNHQRFCSHPFLSTLFGKTVRKHDQHQCASVTSICSPPSWRQGHRLPKHGRATASLPDGKRSHMLSRLLTLSLPLDRNTRAPDARGLAVYRCSSACPFLPP